MYSRSSTSPSGINNLEIENKLIHMIRFIEQEGSEKAEEIDCHTEEECNIEKGIMINTARKQINIEFEKKEGKSTFQERMRTSTKIKEQIEKKVKIKLSIIDDIINLSREQIERDLTCSKRRWGILEKLIMQGLLTLLEKVVTIQCREIDANIITKSLPYLEQSYTNIAKQKISLKMDTTYLSKEMLPGVVLDVENGKMSLNCTLEHRLSEIVQFCTPVICQLFFGSSKMRK